MIAGLFKEEGRYDLGYFRNIKTYLLSNEKGEETRRVKSIPRWVHLQQR